MISACRAGDRCERVKMLSIGLRGSGESESNECNTDAGGGTTATLLMHTFRLISTVVREGTRVLVE